MVMFDITEGKRPPRPVHPALTDDLWELMERCWAQEPDSRPEMLEVLQVLRSSSVSLFTPMTSAAWRVYLTVLLHAGIPP